MTLDPAQHGQREGLVIERPAGLPVQRAGVDPAENGSRFFSHPAVLPVENGGGGAARLVQKQQVAAGRRSRYPPQGAVFGQGRRQSPQQRETGVQIRFRVDLDPAVLPIGIDKFGFSRRFSVPSSATRTPLTDEVPISRPMM